MSLAQFDQFSQINTASQKNRKFDLLDQRDQLSVIFPSVPFVQFQAAIELARRALAKEA